MSTILRSAWVLAPSRFAGFAGVRLHGRASDGRPRRLRADAARRATARTCASCRMRCSRAPSSSARWGNRATSDLIAQARSTMPPDNPGGLPAETYANIVAYLLQVNGGTPSDERDRREHDGARRPRPHGPSRRRGSGRSAPSAPPAPTGVIVAGTVPSFAPVTDAMLRNPDADDWLMLRRDYSATSYSPLDEITPDNAHQLQLAWIWPMRDGGTNQPAPARLRRHDVSREHGRHRASARRANGRPDLGAPRRRRGRAARPRAVRRTC